MLGADLQQVSAHPSTNCPSFVQATVDLGLGASLAVVLECQDVDGHHKEHLAAIINAFDPSGRACMIQATWPNLDHAKCGICHRQIR